MRILMVSGTYGGISGSGQHVRNLWKHLKDKVDLILWNVENVGYIDIPKLRSISFYIGAKMKKIPGEVDIIHVHNPKFAGLFRKDKRNILTIHGEYKKELEIQYGFLAKPVIRYIDRNIRRADAITTVSPLWAKQNNWLWIPNMVDVSDIKKIKPMEEDFLGVKPRKYVLFVGRDDPIKDYPLFRRIVREANRQLRVKAIALGVLRENTDYLRHARVTWKVVISLMKSALAIIITSKHEGLPTALLEAWASGCPVVARKIPPLIALEEMFSGSILFFDSIKSAVEHIRTLYENEDLREKTIKAGFNAVKNFDAPFVVEQYYKLYKEMLERRGPNDFGRW